MWGSPLHHICEQNASRMLQELFRMHFFFWLIYFDCCSLSVFHCVYVYILLSLMHSYCRFLVQNMAVRQREDCATHQPPRGPSGPRQTEPPAGGARSFTQGAYYRFNLPFVHRLYSKPDCLSNVEWNFTKIWVKLNKHKQIFVTLNERLLDLFDFTKLFAKFHSMLLNRSDFE